MRTRHRALTALAMASLVALPLAACSDGSEENPTEAATQEAPPSQDPADATPQERVEAYFDAFDAAAAEGWKDSNYADEYLAPELAETQKADDAKRADSQAIITGERKLSDWTSVNDSGNTVIIEFCNDPSAQEASVGGEPARIPNNNESVATFTLSRDSESDPWMIALKEYKYEGTACAEHFTD
ncbi:hypothetical protein [Brachybacterium sacelli]|uniref:Lipoprotein n=1 Tax=Brachybacterium sacelli TaxID=173364 RepID=A0ABS4WXH4_9MICO|nr:hypothetical protein [Brachybacterium sacelli]MBP2380678.1 hypothetical protein [Brachybacterium sacelli]